MVSPQKVSSLSGSAFFDMENCDAATHIPLGSSSVPIYKATTPRGNCNLFKTLLTNHCKMDCRYCMNSKCSSRRQPASYKPAELAQVFHLFWRKGLVQGLFLSSSIEDPVKNMEEMLEAVAILRHRYFFGGYVHLKILPGAERDQVERAARLADRLSINLESISPSHLSELSSTKDFKNDILKRQGWIREILKRKGRTSNAGLPPENGAKGAARHPRTAASHTTQLIVGALGETDREVFRTAILEYRHMEIRRMYYSPFSPLEGTPLERGNPAPRWRGHRLYQLDWLYREYRFSEREVFSAMEEDFLPNADPKVTIARAFFGEKRQELNGLSYDDLIRIPGIGPRTAQKLSEAKEPLRTCTQLKKHGVNLRRALPFIKVNGHAQTTLAGFN